MYRLTTVVILSLTAGGCAELGRGEPLREVDASAETVAETIDATSEADAIDEVGEVDSVEPAVSYAAAVHEVLIDNCTDSGCHGSGAGGFLLSGDIDSDYAATLNEVTPGNALGSKLVKKATNTSSHTGGPVLAPGTADYDLVVAWINGGANP